MLSRVALSLTLFALVSVCLESVTPALAQTELSTDQQAQLESITRQSPLFEKAAEALDELSKEDQAAKPGSLNRSALLARNLSRYFTRYAVPEDTDELRRFLGTAQRTTRDAGRLFIGAANSVAQSSGGGAISEAHLQQVVKALLPYSETADGDRLYFTAEGLAESEKLLIERWDLEALEKTGMVWEVLADLAQSVVAPTVMDGSGLDLEPNAVDLLADTLNAYGLLVFQLAGDIARASLEPNVANRHLRDAVKVLRARADGTTSPIVPTYQPQRGAATARGAALFTDVTDSVGIDFEHRSSEWIGRFRRFGPIAPTFSGGGAAAGDVNGDDWPDLIVCGGRGCSLYQNRSGEFEDKTTDSGVNIDGEARMPLLADFDNDGDLDLFITYARDPNRLLINDGQGRFKAASGTGLETEGDISGPASALDFDNDGLLDIYVGNFGNYLAGASAWEAREAINGMPNRLYRNVGKGTGPGAGSSGLRFQDVTQSAGVGDTGWAQALSHLDADRDGDQDIYIANDFGRNQLLLNNGDGTFERAGSKTGTDDAFHGMNVAFADLNSDGYGDFFVTNIWFFASAQGKVTETNTLLLSKNEGISTDGSAEPALAYERSEATFLQENDSGWAWAGLFFDLENDGDDDLFVANGFTDYMTFAQYRPHPENQDQLFVVNNGREPNLLFLNTDDSSSAKDTGATLPATLYENSGLELPSTNTRSAVLLDFDRDGDLDLFLTTFHDRARLFRNDSIASASATTGGGAGKFGMLQITLQGDPTKQTNLDAIGAQLRLTLDDGRKVWRTVAGGEGYLGMSDLPVEFGTAGSKPRELEILWPNGDLETISEVPVSGRYGLEQGTATLVPKP